MKFRTLRHSLAASLALCFVASAVSAQSSTNAAGAEALYEEARGLMKQGDFARACPKFKQSYELDPGLMPAMGVVIGGVLLMLYAARRR